MQKVIVRHIGVRRQGYLQPETRSSGIMPHPQPSPLTKGSEHPNPNVTRALGSHGGGFVECMGCNSYGSLQNDRRWCLH